MSLESVQSTANAHRTRGRDGASHRDDGRLDVKGSSSGTPGSGTNPEVNHSGAAKLVRPRRRMIMSAVSSAPTGRSFLVTFTPVGNCPDSRRGTDGFGLFNKAIQKRPSAGRELVATAVKKGIRVPAFSTALAFYDGFRSVRLPANLLQAQRDYSGAHAYERVDKPRGAFFHTNWIGRGGEVAAGTYNV